MGRPATPARRSRTAAGTAPVVAGERVDLVDHDRAESAKNSRR
jgi:hypothetical protein